MSTCATCVAISICYVGIFAWIAPLWTEICMGVGLRSMLHSLQHHALHANLTLFSHFIIHCQHLWSLVKRPSTLIVLMTNAMPTAIMFERAFLETLCTEQAYVDFICTWHWSQERCNMVAWSCQWQVCYSRSSLDLLHMLNSAKSSSSAQQSRHRHPKCVLSTSLATSLRTFLAVVWLYVCSTWSMQPCVCVLITPLG